MDGECFCCFLFEIGSCFLKKEILKMYTSGNIEVGQVKWHLWQVAGVVACFFIGEMIGKGSIKGYKESQND